MKILRHYNKELAVILSVFGSTEPDAIFQYEQLFEEIKQNIDSDIELRLAFSSKTVLKKLEQQGNFQYNLVEQLANLDRLGYKKVVVCSANVFPTEEHEYILQIVDAFRKVISRAQYQVTMPLFTRAETTNKYLSFLNEKFRKRNHEFRLRNNEENNILFIAHGAANLNSSGSNIYPYVRDYLRLLNPQNLFYSIEGAFPYNKEVFLRELVDNTQDNVLIVPLLLVAGNHAKNDILEIRKELELDFKTVNTPECNEESEIFSLLRLKETRDYFIEQIKESIERINW